MTRLPVAAPADEVPEVIASDLTGVTRSREDGIPEHAECWAAVHWKIIEPTAYNKARYLLFVKVEA